MRHSSIPSAQTVIAHCKAKGIKSIIISPGSRNAPLTIGFSEDTYFKCFSIVDERSAAFFALGIAQQLQELVAVVCTSGSALLNYYPAVAEAFYSRIPLVVLSADRPIYKIDVGDGQTIRQDDVFHRHIGYSAHLKQDISHATDKVEKYKPEWMINKSVNEAQEEIQHYNDNELNSALNSALNDRFPVHINIPFEEPLYDFVSKPTVETSIDFNRMKSEETIRDIEELISIWNASERKLVLVGVNYPDTIEQHLLDLLANDPSVMVMTETTSNLHHSKFFPSIDSIIAPIEKSKDQIEFFKALKPDILLTFGGLIVSKKIKAFLRQYKPKHHWHIDAIRAYDTFFSLTKHIKTDANRFLSEFLGNAKKVQSPYFSYWHKLKELYKNKRLEYLEQIPFSDLSAFHFICKNIPKNYSLQLANSSTVRYMQLFDLHPTIHVFCNRGTSGIDGSISTAVGASIYSKNPTLLITGDLSFFYDSNGLWNSYLKSNFRIILINNQGGGIFRILPGKEETPNFENYFETIHDLDAKCLCEMHGVTYLKADNEAALKECFSNFYESSKRPKLMEIVTPRILNDKILIGYFDFISSGLV